MLPTRVLFISISVCKEPATVLSISILTTYTAHICHHPPTDGWAHDEEYVYVFYNKNTLEFGRQHGI